MSEAPASRALRGDPVAFVLDDAEPGAGWRVQVEVLGKPPDSPAVVRARHAARETGCAAILLARQDPLGYWGSPATYGARWGGTAWHVLALAQLGADPEDPRVVRGAETLIESFQPRSAGFAVARNKPPSTCFTAEVCAALTRFGFGHHPRVREAVGWLASRRAEHDGWACPDLRHLVAGGCPVAAVAVLRLFSDTPPSERRTIEPLRQRAAAWLVGLGLLVSAPSPPGWWSLAHPCLGRTDVLDALAALARAGWPAGPSQHEAMARVLERQTEDGRWLQRGHVAFGERHGEPSRWLTLKALVAFAAYGEHAVPAAGGPA